MRNILATVASLVIFAAIAATQTTSPTDPQTAAGDSLPATTSSPTSCPANPLPMSIEQLKQQAQAGDVIAMVDLGDRYYDGDGVKVNLSEAEKWYRLAVAAGNGEAAMCLLKIIIDHDPGKNSDDELRELIEKANQYCTKNAQAGQAREILWLAYIYDWGNGTVKQNRKRAVELLKQSAELGNYWAMRAMFDAYAYGSCGDVDMRVAEIWRAKGIAACEKAVAAGDLRALETLCHLYAGPGNGQDKQKAFEFAQKGANANQAKMMRLLANYYGVGWGVKRDTSMVVKWRKMAAQQLLPTAIDDLGNLYASGIYVEKDIKEAERLFLSTTENGGQARLYSLYRLYRKQGKDEEAEKYYSRDMAWLERAVRLNWYRSADLIWMATRYLLAKKQFPQAIDSLTKSAELGNTFAMYLLGNAYYYGKGAEVDLNKGRQYLEQAAKKRSARAMIELGYIYAKGKNVEKNLDTAAEWYQKAADEGYGEGYLWLGHLYRNKGDYAAALDAYQNGAEKGEDYSMLAIGSLYLHGTGVKQDDRQAIKWMEESAAEGNSYAMNSIGEIFEKGQCKTLAKSTKLAFEWYSKSADCGDGDGLFNLARCYEEGLGTSQDLNKSLEFYKKAETAGNKDAADKVKELSAKLQANGKSATSSPTSKTSPTTQANQ